MPLGSENGTAVLSERDVVEIRQRYLTGHFAMSELAAEWGLPKSTIQAVLCCANWSHLLSEGEAEQLREMREERSTKPRRRTSKWLSK